MQRDWVGMTVSRYPSSNSNAFCGCASSCEGTLSEVASLAVEAPFPNPFWRESLIWSYINALLFLPHTYPFSRCSRDPRTINDGSHTQPLQKQR